VGGCVGHVFGADAKPGKWVQDGMRAWRQSRIHDDDCVPIANKTDGGGHAIVRPSQVALEQDVDLSHRLRIRMSMRQGSGDAVLSSITRNTTLVSAPGGTVALAVEGPHRGDSRP
jgi:hypothetical protein